MERPISVNVEAASLEPTTPLRKIIAVASIAGGIQFGWALQLSLLTPYVQVLGVPHAWASFIWLCGPISGLLVQPIVGYTSDRCTSRFGRRRPFILGGAVAVAVAVFLIGYAADLGHSMGDKLNKKTRPRAVAIYVIGFWILDVANNTLQGPCRAFLGDLAAGDHGKTRMANAMFSFFMAVGNVLGYAAGSINGLHKVFPFTETEACDVFCANLKSCFFFAIILLWAVTIFAIIYVKETPITKSHAADSSSEPPLSCFGELSGTFKSIKKPMWLLMLVTAINWVAWFPFFLYNTDWMGREVYGGDAKTNENAYNKGVQAGSLGLMINAVVLGVMSLAIEPLSRLLRGAKRLWGIVNIILAIGMGMTVVITKVAQHQRSLNPGAVGNPSEGVKAGAMIFFATLGIPLAINFSVPFALASIYSSTSGAGQGLSLGVLNISIVVPQMIVSALSGPWDALFGGGNLPAFVVSVVAAILSAILAVVLLPNPKPEEMAKASAVPGGFH